MKWRRLRASRRPVEHAGGPAFGGGLSRPVAIGGGIGLPALLVVAAIVVLNLLGGSAFDVNTPQLPGSDDPAQGPPGGPLPATHLERFLKFVFDDAQAFWQDTFAQADLDYRPATLTFFTGAVRSACGVADERVGPFYCPADERVYIDTGFFSELRDRFQAPGDFAQAYVIAHEVGHHVQRMLGITGQVGSLRESRPDSTNEISIRTELQADCFAGVWGFTTYERKLLETGDLQEGLRAAAAVGDDRIQAEATGQINPETWTHGSSEQRQRWFLTGFRDGDPNSCDTFSAETL